MLASGKRKTAIARATVTKGTGVIRVNSRPVEIMEPELARLKVLEPLKLAGKKADAARTAIARGIVQYLNDEDLESLYRDYDRTLVVPDTRRKLPKNPLGRGARKKRQKSYR